MRNAHPVIIYPRKHKNLNPVTKNIDKLKLKRLLQSNIMKCSKVSVMKVQRRRRNFPD